MYLGIILGIIGIWDKKRIKYYTKRWYNIWNFWKNDRATFRKYTLDYKIFIRWYSRYIIGKFKI